MCYDIGYIEDRTNKEEERWKTKYEKIDVLETLKKIHHVSGFAHPMLPVMTSDKRSVIQLMEWGLIPSWVKDAEKAKQLSEMCLNAKAETIFEKPSFKSSIMKRRCVVIVDGFYEWMHMNKIKYPHFITLKSELPMPMGGIWSSWIDKDTGEERHTFAIITVSANTMMEKIHNTKMRMPFIIPEDKIDTWLDESLTKEEIAELMQPYHAKEMEARTIRKFRRGEANYPETQNEFKYPELELIGYYNELDKVAS